MGRRTEKTEFVSQDIIHRLKVISRGNLIWLWREHAEFRGLGIQNFYAGMRADYCTKETITCFEALDTRFYKDGTYESFRNSLAAS